MSLGTSLRTRWKTWLVGGVALAVVLVVGVPYAYIHFVEGSQPAPLATSTTERAAPTGAAQGDFTVAAGSQAGYRVHEILAGQSVEAVGRTDSVTGTATVQGTTVTKGTTSVDLASVRSDQSRRDAQFTGNIMNTAQFPTATFTLTQPLELGDAFTNGSPTTVTATGELTLHGVTKPVELPLTAARNGSGIQVTGSVPVTFADYGIQTPSIGDFVKADPQGSIEFQLNLSSAG